MVLLRETMSAHVGVLRDAGGLSTALETIEDLEQRNGVTAPTVAARCVVHAATERHESRGAHARRDLPQTDDMAKHSRLLWPQITGVPA